MPAHLFAVRLWVSIALAGLVHGHISAFGPGLFGAYNPDGTIRDPNDNRMCHPLYELPYSEYWMHRLYGVGDEPPPPDKFLEIPAGGVFEVDLTDNLWNSKLTTTNHPLSAWPDGLDHPDDLHGSPGHCITKPNLHTMNQSSAAGTAFAISYNADYKTVTPEDFVVFSVAPNTPWKRVTTYKVPSGLPPTDKCLAIWGWVPNHCGQPNMNIVPFSCKVISDGSPPRTIGKPQPAVQCIGDSSKCLRGPKQLIIHNQLEGNNVVTHGTDSEGLDISPGYNDGFGFFAGAQNDIFVDDPPKGNPSQGAHSKRMMRQGKHNMF